MRRSGRIAVNPECQPGPSLERRREHVDLRSGINRVDPGGGNRKVLLEVAKAWVMDDAATGDAPDSAPPDECVRGDDLRGSDQSVPRTGGDLKPFPRRVEQEPGNAEGEEDLQRPARCGASR